MSFGSIRVADYKAKSLRFLNLAGAQLPTSPSSGVLEVKCNSSQHVLAYHVTFNKKGGFSACNNTLFSRALRFFFGYRCSASKQLESKLTAYHKRQKELASNSTPSAGHVETPASTLDDQPQASVSASQPKIRARSQAHIWYKSQRIVKDLDKMVEEGRLVDTNKPKTLGELSTEPSSPDLRTQIQSEE